MTPPTTTPSRRPAPPPTARWLRALAVATAIAALPAGAHANDVTVTDRQIEVAGSLNVRTATKIADRVVKFDAERDAPIHLTITATDGSAQGVMILADAIQSVRSPVVALVVTQVHGAGAALAPFADRVYLFPSAGLVFTELDYEGVKKPEPPPDPGEAGAPKVDPPSPAEQLLQDARARYLDRFVGRLAARIGTPKAELERAIADGGRIVDAAEAVDAGIAYAIVERMRYVELPEDKIEYKVTTTRKTTHTPEPPSDGRDVN